MPTRRSLGKAPDGFETPTIACFNRATVQLGVDYEALIDALGVYVGCHVAPVWGTPARLRMTPTFQPGAWGIVFLDDADAAGDLAYHELTPDGFPLAKVFVRSTLKAGDTVSSSVSHELVEMLVDPAINLYASGPKPATFYSYESADPVEELAFDVDGIPMSDFVYPAYFELFHKPRAIPLDHMGKVKYPFEILPGGYQQLYRHGRWTNHTVATRTKKRLREEDRRYHRSELRKRPGIRRRCDPAEIARRERRRGLA